MIGNAECVLARENLEMVLNAERPIWIGDKIILYKMMHGMIKYFENATNFKCNLCNGQTQPKFGFGNKNFQTETVLRPDG